MTALTQEPTTINEVADMLNAELWVLPQTGAKSAQWSLISAMLTLGFRFDSGAGNMPGEYWDVYANKALIQRTVKGWRVRHEQGDTLTQETFDRPGDAILWAYQSYIQGT